jgi:hypothetical protein
MKHATRTTLFLALIGLTCVQLWAGPATTQPVKFRVGKITDPGIPESSGIVASRKHEGVYWTHNDSGNPPELFAITREGQLIHKFEVAAKNVDWEDLALDDAGHIYIADTGNNNRDRTEVHVYRVDEPDPRAKPPGNGAKTPPLRVNAHWRLNYPDKPFDCESLFLLGGKAYLISKNLTGAAAVIYRFDLAAPMNRPVVLEHVTEIPLIHAPVTAADVSEDGKRLAVMTVIGPYVLEINGDVASAPNAKARHCRYFDPHMEAVCFVKEGLLATTESRDVFLFRDEFLTPVK